MSISAAVMYLDCSVADVPRGHLLDARSVLELAPAIPADGLAGGAVWHDLVAALPGPRDHRSAEVGGRSRRRRRQLRRSAPALDRERPRARSRRRGTRWPQRPRSFGRRSSSTRRGRGPASSRPSGARPTTGSRRSSSPGTCCSIGPRYRVMPSHLQDPLSAGCGVEVRDLARRPAARRHRLCAARRRALRFGRGGRGRRARCVSRGRQSLRAALEATRRDVLRVFSGVLPAARRARACRARATCSAATGRAASSRYRARNSRRRAAQRGRRSRPCGAAACCDGRHDGAAGVSAVSRERRRRAIRQRVDDARSRRAAGPCSAHHRA